ncbi:hypothetical protein OGATHE_003246 [Ogataea polymorpha]|uniref:Hydantoinase/oxoprolinase N-terminal domain-containing protein n=1 Tax=Ogataea polymorpha TaxID=460523 RepID=A0A9P8P8V6_9ASCO|nr:hypothetical protein OGATHE_003246 [Ogataea polymorpha]
MSKNLIIGLEFGGTNSDLVVLDPSRLHDADCGVLAWHKSATTPDVSVGIENAIRAVLEAPDSLFSRNQISTITIGTTHFINVVVKRDFPDDLGAIINGYSAVLEGNVQVDGTKIRPLNESEIRQHCHQIRQLGLRTVDVVATFANIDSSHELPRRNGIDCSILLSQNDGTVLSVQEALKTPVKTFSSGATNSMGEASVLCLHDPVVKGRNVMVCDVGGTTTDVGMLLASGLPRPSATSSYAGGLRINFLMPYVESIGLGGGSIVRQEKGRISAGPDSTGAEIVSRGVLFGGDTVTASDLSSQNG